MALLFGRAVAPLLEQLGLDPALVSSVTIALDEDSDLVRVEVTSPPSVSSMAPETTSYCLLDENGYPVFAYAFIDELKNCFPYLHHPELHIVSITITLSPHSPATSTLTYTLHTELEECRFSKGYTMGKVKGGRQNTRQMPLPPQVKELIENNPIVFRLYGQAHGDGWSYERFLEKAIVALAEHNKELLSALTHRALREPPSGILRKKEGSMAMIESLEEAPVDRSEPPTKETASLEDKKGKKPLTHQKWSSPRSADTLFARIEKEVLECLTSSGAGTQKEQP